MKLEFLKNSPCLSLLFFLANACTSIASDPVTNYKSGISIKFSGQDEKDFAVERWYFDPLVDDHGVVYIKDSTKISFTHNERNTASIYSQTLHRRMRTIVDPSKGVIRYKIDRDQNYRYIWASSTTFKGIISKEKFPEFKEPFSFQELTYAPDDPSVKVVGVTGPKPGIDLSIENRDKYYYRGMSDSCGDEWHIITVGDDDNGVDPYQPNGIEGRHACSDGKIHYFIVNPKTPAINFECGDPKAQYYTTPIKNYFIPVLHEQTTYATDGVKIHLVNIMSNAPVFYRFDKAAFKKYEGPIPVSALSNGMHVLEYYYTDSNHRTRTIVKNPDFPSDNDAFAANGPKKGNHQHGYILWRDDAEFQKFKDRVTGHSTSPELAAQQALYEKMKTDPKVNKQDEFNAAKRKGVQIYMGNDLGDAPLINALVAKIEGMNKSMKHALCAKEMMFDNEMTLDQVGYELSSWDGATPYGDFTCGYYRVQPHIGVALAYDLLIKDFRAPKYENGFTPVEDLKVRDIMCNYIWILELHRAMYNRGYEFMNFWATCRSVGALITAMAMPSYDTLYYGTSGFNGVGTTRTGLPFPDQAATWYQLLYEDSVPKKPFPNQALDFGLFKSKIISFTGEGGKKSGEGMDGCFDEAGVSIIPKSGYNGYSVLGKIFGIYGNIMLVAFDKRWPSLDAWFEKCNNGTQPNDEQHHIAVGFYPNPLCINEYFPSALAQTSLVELKEKGELKKQDIYTLLFTHPDLKPKERK